MVIYHSFVDPGANGDFIDSSAGQAILSKFPTSGCEYFFAGGFFIYQLQRDLN